MKTSKKRILVITDHMPWGHRSIAKAIYNFLKDKEKDSNYQVEFMAIPAKTGIGGDIYNFVYKYMPSSNIVAHRLSHNEMLINLFKEVSRMNLPDLKRAVKRYKPDLVISAYFLHSHSLSKWRETDPKANKFELWTVVADPWTINPLSFVSGADRHLVYDEVGRELAKKYGVNPKTVMVSGWWTRPEMYQKYNQAEARKKLGLSVDMPVVFVGGGSLGTSALPKILPTLLVVRSKMGIIFNSGKDKLGYTMVDEFARWYRRIKKDGLVEFVNLGWIDDMAQVLAAADIVFGKAGPNFLFDVVAARKPFVAITHIGGQEDGNIDIINKKKLGWVKEKNGTLGKFLLEYLENSQRYNQKFKETIAAEALRNQKTLERIWREVEERQNKVL